MSNIIPVGVCKTGVENGDIAGISRSEMRTSCEPGPPNVFVGTPV